VPITSRTRLIAVLATALVLLSTLNWSSGAHAAPVPAKQKSPYSRAQAEKILATVQQALAPKKDAARKHVTALPRRDLGLEMHRLQVAKGALSAQDQRSADIATSRPVPAAQGCADYTPLAQSTWTALASAHFCLHYRLPSTNNPGATTPYWANQTLNVLEHVYSEEVIDLGYRRPLNDGDHLYDVFLDQIGDQGYYGFCTTDTGSRVSTAWCELDNDFSTAEFGSGTIPLHSLKVTAAHEFFHAVQFAYDAGEGAWFMEGTAVWMEDQVYPTINDYLQYLTYSQITQPEVPIDYAGTFERYGAVIFWKYLSEGYHDVTIIRRIWTAAAVSHGATDGLRATIDVLANKHVNFADAFARFSVWNTLPPGSYADRKLFPHPASWGTARLGTTKRDSGTGNVSLDHLSSANVAFVPSPALPSKSRLTISVNAPGNHTAQVRLQVRKTDGSTTYVTFTLNSSGDGTHSIYFSGKTISSVRLTLVNVRGTADGQAYAFRGRVTLP